jgi:AmiR/NasT family two-component response regulator
MIRLGGALTPPPLADDLRDAGLTVLDSSDSPNFVQHVLASAPDLIILHQDTPDAALFENAAAVAQLAPRPVIVFTLDPDADNIARAMTAGVHAYIINGYSPTRLRSVIHLAQARFQRDQLIKEELAQVNQRFEERKLVDRAKGILMGARQLREEEAYRVLRRVAMHTKQRIGQISQRVIDAARYGEAINRAGQLRMLSQRLVKLYALTEAGIRTPDTAGLMTDSIALVDDTLAILVRSLSKATFGDLVEAVTSAWVVLKRMLEAPAQAARFEKVDAAAEAVLVRSEQLTDNLEVSGFATALHVINVSGRQRMLSQRLAKSAILAAKFDGSASLGAHEAAMAATAELAEGLDYLRNLPLTNAAITAELEQATASWDAFQVALGQCGTPEGLALVAELSETLLGQFDLLTTHYERAMQAFVN